jgi:acyl-CoA hydrolase
MGAVGGAVDFARRGQERGGLPIVALPATAKGASRIVAQLSGPVSTPRSDAGLIVTEHGVADLRGQPLSRRVRRLIDIAAPEHRESLERQAHELLRRCGAVQIAVSACGISASGQFHSNPKEKHHAPSRHRHPLRTPVGTFGGSLRPVSVEELAATTVRAVVQKAA